MVYSAAGSGPEQVPLTDPARKLMTFSLRAMTLSSQPMTGKTMPMTWETVPMGWASRGIGKLSGTMAVFSQVVPKRARGMGTNDPVIEHRSNSMSKSIVSIMCSLAIAAGVSSAWAQPGTPVVLRDSIGPDTALTNGGLTIANTGGSATGVSSFVSMNITPSETVSLREVSMLVGSWADQDPSIIFANFDYEVRIWSSPQGPQAAPSTGNVLDCFFNFPSNVNSNGETPPVFGSVTSYFGIQTPSLSFEF